VILAIQTGRRKLDECLICLLKRKEEGGNIFGLIFLTER
jgi:hypothetical protein